MKNNISVDDVIFDPPLISTRTVNSVRAEQSHPEYLSLGIPELKPFVMARKSKVIGILADTSQGKTSIMRYIARQMVNQIDAEHDEIGMFFTWEDNIEDFGMVDIANISKIPVSSLYNGTINESEFKRMMKASAQRAGTPLWLAGHSETSTTRPMLTMTDTFEVCDNIVNVQKKRMRFIMLDYLQRINREDTGERDTRMQFVKIMDLAKNLALTYKACVFVGSQVRRDQVEKGKWRQPQRHWAMETSNFEHTCDGLFSLWMPSKSKDVWKDGECLQEKQGINGKAINVTKELMLVEILKQKYGETELLSALDFIPEYGMFEEYGTAAKVRAQIKEDYA